MHKILLLLLSLLYASTAQASVIGAPLCKATVIIEESTDDFIRGHLDGEHCGAYNAMTIEIRDSLNHIPFNKVSLITLGVQPFSTMGPNGPVEGHHWDVLDIRMNTDTDISRITTEFVTVKILKMGNE